MIQFLDLWLTFLYLILVFAKGQIQIPPYRFLAKQGGYAWVQTQATLVVYGQNRHFRTEAVVCVHTCLRCVPGREWFKPRVYPIFFLSVHFRSTVKFRIAIKSYKGNNQPMAQFNCAGNRSYLYLTRPRYGKDKDIHFKDATFNFSPFLDSIRLSPSSSCWYTVLAHLTYTNRRIIWMTLCYLAERGWSKTMTQEPPGKIG